MLSIFRRRSRFAQALADFGLERCSVSSDGQLWIGIAAHDEYGRAPLVALPEPLNAVCFVEGPRQTGFVAAFVASPESKAVTALMIGTTHDYIGKDTSSGTYDFAPAVASLRGATMPALEKLTLGDMEQLFNGHVYYGRLGDITHVFDMAPGLCALSLCGCSELTRPVRHDALETLHLRLDDIGVSGGPLGQATVDNVLTSRFPRLHTLELALDEAEATPYSVPEAFFADNGFPALRRFGMDWLKPEIEPRLRAWAAERKLQWTL